MNPTPSPEERPEPPEGYKLLTDYRRPPSDKDAESVSDFLILETALTASDVDKITKLFFELATLRSTNRDLLSLVDTLAGALKLVSEAKVFCADSMDIDNHATWAVDEALAAVTAFKAKQ